MNVLSKSELIEAVEGMAWQELDALIEVSRKKRDMVTVHACVTELEHRKWQRADDPIGYVMALNRGRGALRNRGFALAAH